MRDHRNVVGSPGGHVFVSQKSDTSDPSDPSDRNQRHLSSLAHFRPVRPEAPPAAPLTLRLCARYLSQLSPLDMKGKHNET